ncbi:MAG: hypothetical protein PVH00_03040, partial [Gemmatimonadota bacterium]
MERTRFGRYVAAVVLVWAIASVNVFWVGGATLYSASMQERRESLHRAVLSGELPAGVGSWNEVGANTAALRPAVPWLAEQTASVTGLRLATAYQLIEWTSIAIAIAMLFLILHRFVSLERALIGCLYVGVVLPLSYMAHYFQPWDKPALALWLAAAFLLLTDAVIPAGAVIALAVLVKFDAVVLPALYMLLYAGRGKASRFATRSAYLWLTALVPFALLQWLRPGASEPRHPVGQLTANAGVFREMWYAYPPMIGFLLPSGSARS